MSSDGLDGETFSRAQKCPNGNWTTGWVALAALPVIPLDILPVPRDRGLFTQLLIKAEGLNAGDSVPIYRSQKSSFVVGSEKWSSWQRIFYTPAGVVLTLDNGSRNSDGHLELFAHDNQGNKWHSWELPDGVTWSGEWDNLGHPGSERVDAYDVALDQQGCLTILALTTGGLLAEMRQLRASGEWGTWTPVESVNQFGGFLPPQIALATQQNGLLMAFCSRNATFYYVRQLSERA